MRIKNKDLEMTQKKKEERIKFKSDTRERDKGKINEIC